MTNSQHTSGPWKYSISTPAQESAKHEGKNCGANCHIWANTDRLIYGRDPGKAICFPPHWRDEKDNTEEIANIKLIAAAPDMLESLEIAQLELKAWADLYPEDEDLPKALKMVREAIKKATQ